MKLIRTANGKQQIKISRKEWLKLGQENGWSDNSGTSSKDPFVVAFVESILDKAPDPNNSYMYAVGSLEVSLSLLAEDIRKASTGNLRGLPSTATKEIGLSGVLNEINDKCSALDTPDVLDTLDTIVAPEIL